MSPFRVLALRHRQGALAPIPEEEIACRRAFEEWMREQGLPGHLGVEDSTEMLLVYAGWRAAWTWRDVMP